MSTPRGIVIQPQIPICQTDLPLDTYQPEFKPYAEEYLALPDRLPGTVLRWMDRYIEPARAELGPGLVLLAHYYMGGEIVKLVERYGGMIADSYQLAREAVLHPEKRFFVESAVHFMAEAIALLDLWRRGKAPDLNRVLAGDVVDEISGARERLDASGQARVAREARRALERMIEITEAAR